MNCTLQTLSSEAKSKPDKTDVAELRAKVSCDFYHPTTCTLSNDDCCVQFFYEHHGNLDGHGNTSGFSGVHVGADFKT